MERITSRENRWVKQYTKLLSSRRARRETGEFTAEGVRLVGEAAAYGTPVAVFYTEECLTRFPQQLSPILSQTKRQFLITPSVALKLSDTRLPQGVFAIVKQPVDRVDPAALREKGRYVMLCGIQDPGNLGTVFRTAEALGLDGVLLDEACCDPLSPKAVRGSMGAVFRLPFGSAALSNLTFGLPTYAAVLSADAKSITDCDFSEGGVMLIGNEGNGLPDKVIEAASHRITIPMAGCAESLNAAAAAAILLWEMCKKGGAK